MNGSVAQKVCTKITMEKDVNKFVEDYKNYTGSSVKVQKTLGATGKTLIKSEL